MRAGGHHLLARYGLGKEAGPFLGISLQIAKELDQKAFKRVVITRARSSFFRSFNPGDEGLRGPQRPDQVVVEFAATGSGFGYQLHLLDKLVDLGVPVEWWLAPGRGMITPFNQLPGGILELRDGWAGVKRVARSQARQRAPQCRSAFGQLLLKPRAEGALEDTRGLLFG